HAVNLQHVENLQALLHEREAEVASAQAYIASLNEQLEQQKIENNASLEYSASLRAALDQSQSEQAALQEEMVVLQKELVVNQQARHEATIYATSLETARAEKETELHVLHQAYAQTFNELTGMRRSLLYRLMVRPVWKLRRTIFPDQSARGRAYLTVRRLLR
ncbi:MAG: hypothetical protein ABI835_20630, partial [Chloroflexota bacterium]